MQFRSSEDPANAPVAAAPAPAPGPAMVPAMVLADPNSNTIQQTLAQPAPAAPSLSTTPFGPAPPVQYQSPWGGGGLAGPITSPPSPAEHAERVTAEAVPDGTLDGGAHKEYYPNREEDPAQGKLHAALEAIKTDILGLVRKIKEEDKWVESVREIIDTYNEKIARVEADIERLKVKLGDLSKKKHMIENLALQRKLESKLKEANSDLTTLQSAIEHVRSRENEFGKTKSDVLGTIGQLESQLELLKGVKSQAHRAKHEKDESRLGPEDLLHADEDNDPDDKLPHGALPTHGGAHHHKRRRRNDHKGHEHFLADDAPGAVPAAAAAGAAAAVHVPPHPAFL